MAKEEKSLPNIQQFAYSKAKSKTTFLFLDRLNTVIFIYCIISTTFFAIISVSKVAIALYQFFAIIIAFCIVVCSFFVVLIKNPNFITEFASPKQEVLDNFYVFVDATVPVMFPILLSVSAISLGLSIFTNLKKKCIGKIVVTSILIVATIIFYFVSKIPAFKK